MKDQDFTHAPSASGFGFTLRDLLAVGFRHKRAFVLCFVGILLGTIAAILLLPASYDSTAQIVVKRERVDPVVTAEKNDPTQIVGEVTEEQLNSEAQLILSEDVFARGRAGVRAGQAEVSVVVSVWRESGAEGRQGDRQDEGQPAS